MLKYQPLANHLRAIPPNRQTATLSFQQINEMVSRSGKGDLPHSAYVWGKQGFWFNNTGSPQGRAWLCAGWEVCDVKASSDHNPYTSWVTFRRPR